MSDRTTLYDKYMECARQQNLLIFGEYEVLGYLTLHEKNLPPGVVGCYGNHDIHISAPELDLTWCKIAKIGQIQGHFSTTDYFENFKVTGK